MRAVRDENQGLQRRRSLQKLMDREAEEACLNLLKLKEDIHAKTAKHSSRIFSLKE